ncbi:MAG: hypothetical protein Q8P54_00965 [bacterium]|nr:hypothetical protein [bacterium]
MPEQQISSPENLPNLEQNKELVENLKKNIEKFVSNRREILEKLMGENNYRKYFDLLKIYQMEASEEKIPEDFKDLESKYTEALDKYDSKIGTRININKVPEKTLRNYSYPYRISDTTGDTLESIITKEIYFDENGKIRAFSIAPDQEKPAEIRSRKLIETTREMERDLGTNDQKLSNRDITITNNMLDFLNLLQEKYLETLNESNESG